MRRARIKPVALIPTRKRPPTASADALPQSPAKKQNEERSPAKIASPVNPPRSPVNPTQPVAAENGSDGKMARRRTMKPLVNIPARKAKLQDSAPNKSDSPRKETEKDSVLISEQSKVGEEGTNVSDTIYESSRVDKDSASNTIDGIRPLVSRPIKQLEEVTQGKSMGDDSAFSTECNFDPIIPLPSLHKNRPKLKPAPRFATRRNSCQGSASESEDEVKKPKPTETAAHSSNVAATTPKFAGPISAHNRTRNESVCSVATDLSVHATPLLTPRQKSTKWRTVYTSDGIRRAIARKRGFQHPPENPLTMSDLIYYNPPNNAMKSNPSRRDSQSVKEEVKAPESKPETPKTPPETDSESGPAVPVPQVKLGPNGEIILDEKSLVIETTDAIKSRSELSNMAVVYESGSNSGGGIYRRASRSRDWSNSETLRFYKAISTIGTDFGLMLCLFPGRTRKDLKVKFKKEEKNNAKLVNKALMNPLHFDISELQQQLKDDQDSVSQKKEPKKREKLKTYYKSSAAARSLDISASKDAGEDLLIHEDEDPSLHRIASKKNANRATNKHQQLSDGRVALTREEFNRMQSDPARMLPADVEAGSLVILVNRIQGLPGHNTLQPYVVAQGGGGGSTPGSGGGRTQLTPVQMDGGMLMSIAKAMNIMKPGEKYTMATPERARGGGGQETGVP